LQLVVSLFILNPDLSSKNNFFYSTRSGWKIVVLLKLPLMILYCLRHGDVLEQGYDDVSWPLSSLGEEQAAAAAKTLKASNINVDRILASPLMRAKQMAAIIQTMLEVKEFSLSEYLVPGTDHRQLFQYLNTLSDRSVLLVGHEPQLRGFISALVNKTRDCGIELRKGTLVCLDVARPIQPGGGMLKWLLTAEQMRHWQGEG
jgi:phosphohistidine phosphatase SixA